MHQAQTGAVALFGVGAVLHLPTHHSGCGRTHLLAPIEEFGRCPVRGWHMLRCRGVCPDAVAQRVGGDPFVAVQHLQRRDRDTQLHHLPYQRMGHRVMVAFKLNVVVDVDAPPV